MMRVGLIALLISMGISFGSGAVSMVESQANLRAVQIEQATVTHTASINK